MKEELNDRELQKTAGGVGQLEASGLTIAPPPLSAHPFFVRYCPKHGKVEVESDGERACPICGSPLTEES